MQTIYIPEYVMYAPDGAAGCVPCGVAFTTREEAVAYLRTVPGEMAVRELTLMVRGGETSLTQLTSKVVSE